MKPLGLAMVLAALALPVPLCAQDGGVTVIPLEPVPGDPLRDPESDFEQPDLLFDPEVTEQRDRVTSAGSGVLRGLDKLTGDVGDIALARGETKAFGRIQVTLGDCRYPTANPSGDAYAYLVIREAGSEQPAFAGWMVASSPALNPLEHPRYDVWVLRCNS